MTGLHIFRGMVFDKGDELLLREGTGEEEALEVIAVVFADPAKGRLCPDRTYFSETERYLLEPAVVFMGPIKGRHCAKQINLLSFYRAMSVLSRKKSCELFRCQRFQKEKTLCISRSAWYPVHEMRFEGSAP